MIAQRCPKCDVALLRKEPKEINYYYIGDYAIKVEVLIDKTECPKCGRQFEDGNARHLRNDAYRRAINNFWEDKLTLFLTGQEIMELREFARKLFKHTGLEKKRQMSQEFGKWLAGCHFE